MMGAAYRTGLRAGAVMGVVVAFLVVIGLPGVVAAVLSGILGGGAAGAPGVVALVSLLGLWSGWRGAPAREPDAWPRAASGGLGAGVGMGAVVAALAAVLGAVAARGADLRTYLNQLSPAAIDELLLGRDGIAAAAIYFVLLVALGTTGGLLARGVGRGSWRAVAGRDWDAGRDRAREGFARLVRQRPVLVAAGRMALVGALLLFPLALGKYWNFTLGTVGIYVLMALGLNVVVGLAGLLDLGYVAFFAVGAYTVALLTAPLPHGILSSFWVAVPIGVGLAAAAGVVLGVPVLRLRGDYLAIVTLGFGEIIRILIKSEVLTGLTGGPQGVRDIGGPMLLGRPFASERDFLYLILVAIALVIFVTRRLERSRVGRTWVAMREDETVAQAMGISVYRAKLLAFAIGAAFAGLGGALFAARNQYTGPEDHNLMVSINVLCMVIVGGMGSVPGVVLGAFVLKGLPEILRQVDEYRMLAFGALLVTMMVWRPQGLWPSARRRLELPGGAADPGGVDGDGPASTPGLGARAESPPAPDTGPPAPAQAPGGGETRR